MEVTWLPFPRGLRMPERSRSLASVQKRIISCRRCPRLVRWRERVAREKVRRFAGQEYWGKPVPGFGDPRARLLLVGLAPAAHGGNRTGRMFTGDQSGTWLFRALYKANFTDRMESVDRFDGLTLTDCYVTATLRCAPPGNKPLPGEILCCRPHLLDELALLPHVRVVVGLGRIGFESALNAYRLLGRIAYERKPAFGHGATIRFGDLTFFASFHPSQQNTFTGRLTEGMLDEVFRDVRNVLA